MALIKPKEFKTSFYDIDFKHYYDLGFREILLDIDNTLAPYNNLVLDSKQKEFINNVRNMGFRVFLFSNNSPYNIAPLAKELNIEYMGHVYKPFLSGYKRFFKEYDSDKSKILCIGDQLLTDMLGANRLGLYCIYVDPLTKTDKLVTIFSRTFERIWFKLVYKRKHRFNKDYVK